MDNDDENLPFSRELRSTHVLGHSVMPKIWKCKRVDPEKHLSAYNTHMSLRGATPAMKCKAFHLALNGVAEI